MLNFLGTNSLLRFQVTNRPWFFGLLFCALFWIVSSTLLVLGGSDENPKPIEETTPIEPAPQTLQKKNQSLYQADQEMQRKLQESKNWNVSLLMFITSLGAITLLGVLLLLM